MLPLAPLILLYLLLDLLVKVELGKDIGQEAVQPLSEGHHN